jgi:transposase
MKIYKIKSTPPNPTGGQDIYIGIDVHLKTWHVTIVHDGVVLLSISMPAQWTELQKILHRYTAYRMHAVYEAGYFGYCLHDHLIDYGVDCIVTPPSLIPREYGNYVKTDRLDSKRLAILLSQGALKRIAVPTKEQRSHQSVIRRRNQLVKDSVRIQNRIKADLQLHDIPFPVTRGRWSRTVVENLHRLQFYDRWLAETFQRLLAQYDFLREEIEKQTKLIHELSKLDCYRDNVKVLQTIPGIGILVAMELLVELQDLRRFRTADQLAAYIGLTPSQYSSGEHIRMGRITHIGKSHLRALLVESSWVLIRKDPNIAQKYQILKYRSGAKKAIVAIARKLIIRARRIVLDQTPYIVGTAA